MQENERNFLQSGAHDPDRDPESLDIAKKYTNSLETGINLLIVRKLQIVPIFLLNRL